MQKNRQTDRETDKETTLQIQRGRHQRPQLLRLQYGQVIVYF